MDATENYFAANQNLWNERVASHMASDFYRVADFRAGKTSLNAIELNALGDVRGKSLLHLQCHFGLDTLSWAREGATVTGVDFSGEAIKAAEKLRDEMKLNGNFIECNIYDLPEKSGKQFDIVFTSYGTIGWLPDLDKWAKIVSQFLKPGGIFLIVDFHPFLWMFDEQLRELKYSYFNDAVIVSEINGSYADEAERKEQPKKTEYGWNHNFAEVTGALLKQGLQITAFEEFPYSPYNCFENLIQRQDGMWIHKTHGEKFPMLYSIKAVKS
jgi:ubiquinone/menaquinone biosynthesis C-methylase UbiE